MDLIHREEKKVTLKTGKQKLYKIEAQKKKNFLKIPADFIKIYINF